MSGNTALQLDNCYPRNKIYSPWHNNHKIFFANNCCGAVSFFSQGFRCFICFDYPWPLSYASIVSAVAIESTQYFFHVLMVKGEVFSRQFCIFIMTNQVIFDTVSYFCMWILIDYFGIFEFKYIIDYQAG